MAPKKTTPETKTAGETPRAPRKRKTAAAAKPAAKPAAKTAAPRRARTTAATKAPAKTADVAPAGPAAPERSRPSREAIAARAAEIWRARGGTPFDNWIQAERELDA